MRIRLRHPEGVATINIADSATVGDLRHEITEKSGVKAYDLKKGYPPQPLELDAIEDSMSLADSGLKLNGEQLIVAQRDVQAPLQQPLNKDEPPPGAGSRLPPVNPLKARQQQEAQQSSFGSSATAQSGASQDPALDSPEVFVPSRDGTLLLRVMPDDNSCMFRALSFVMLGPGIDSMHELRSLVASTIAADPEKYSDAILGKPRDQYCRWIRSAASWGGYVELTILSQHFGTEISSINVQDGRVDRFNEGAERRCILVYSGIHYDAVSLSPNDRLGFGRKAEPEDDVKVFESSDDVVLVAALDLCKLLREKHYYTDTSNFTIKCNVCGWTGSGEKGALEHAQTTGHMNFGES